LTVSIDKIGADEKVSGAVSPNLSGRKLSGPVPGTPNAMIVPKSPHAAFGAGLSPRSVPDGVSSLFPTSSPSSSLPLSNQATVSDQQKASTAAARWTWAPEDWARATTEEQRLAMTRFASGDSSDEWGLTTIATVLRNLCLRTDAHPLFINDGGVEVLVRMIEIVPPNRTIQRLAVAALADVIPYYTVKAIDSENVDKRLLLGALVSLLKVSGTNTLSNTETDETMSVLSVDSLCRLCVVPAVQHYICSATPTLELLLVRWKGARDPLKLSILSFFAKVADHPYVTCVACSAVCFYEPSVLTALFV
jgi:hypothetical protein